MIWSCAFFINAIYWVETFPLYSYFLSVCYEYLLYFVKYFFCISWDDHMLLILMLWCMCLNLRNPMDCSLPGSSLHGILQARILEWVAISVSRRSSQPRVWTWISCICRPIVYCLNHQGSPKTRQGCLVSSILFSIVLMVLCSVIRQESEIKSIQVGKQKLNFFFYFQKTLCCVKKNPNGSIS